MTVNDFIFFIFGLIFFAAFVAVMIEGNSLAGFLITFGIALFFFWFAFHPLPFVFSVTPR